MTAVGILALVMSGVPALLALIIIADAWVFNVYKNNVCSRSGLTLSVAFATGYFIFQAHWILSDTGKVIGEEADLLWSCMDALALITILKFQHRDLLCSRARTSMTPYLPPPSTGDQHPAAKYPCVNCPLFINGKCTKQQPCQGQ